MLDKQSKVCQIERNFKENEKKIKKCKKCFIYPYLRHLLKSGPWWASEHGKEERKKKRKKRM